MSRSAYRLVVLSACVTAGLIAGSSTAQQGAGTDAVTAAQPSVVINYKERPRVPFDPQRLKLRPVLDGEIGDTEWTPLFTVSDGPVTGTVYLNWDEDGVYIAAKTAQAAWVVVDLDASGDGWLRGADNLEIAVGPVGTQGVPPLTVRLLDAATSRDVPVWNETVVNPRQVDLIVRQHGSGQVVEMAIPRGVAGLTPRSGGLIGARVDLLPSATVPVATAPYEPHLLLDLTLVEAKASSVGGVVGKLALEDTELVPGQVFHATLSLTNQVDATRRIRSLTWNGVGPAAEYLKSLREVALPPLKGLSTERLRYASPLPDTALPGHYQFTATATLDDGSTVSSTASFSIEEPFAIQLDCDPQEVTVVGPTPVRFVVTVMSAVPGFKRADVTLAIPASWELKGKPRRSVNIHRENGSARAVYAAVIPSAMPAGEYRVTAEVAWRGKTWLTHRVVKVSRPQQSP